MTTMDYTVRSINQREVVEWLLKKHYAKRRTSISHAFGLFNAAGIMEGVCTFGVPASQFLCSGVCGDEYRYLVLEFNRLCLSEPHDRNIASFLIGRAMSLLPRPRILVSYADTGMGHIGYVYQSTNWIYTGLTRAMRRDRVPESKAAKHSRHVFDPDAPLVERPRKHRYIMFLGSKKERKAMSEALRWPILPYPKGESQRYDASHKPVTQMVMF